MRNEMENLLKDELRLLAIRTRERLNLTQREMANKLVMSESSYSDIETGVHMCGTLTAVLLISEQKDADAYLKSIQMKFKQLYEDEIQLL